MGEGFFRAASDFFAGILTDFKEKLGGRAEKGPPRQGAAPIGTGSYYQNERVRILMDGQEARSCSNFHYDRQSAVDLRLSRSPNGEIEKIGYLTPAEAEKILSERNSAL